jgi:transposase-like protein
MNAWVGGRKSESVAALPAICADEQKAVEFFERGRWGDSPSCIHCGSVVVYQMKDRKTGQRNKRWLWRCKDCGKQYTVRVGTILEDSLIPFRFWALAFWAANAGKKGVSALQLQRMTGLSYKAAHFMMHRIRYAMSDEPLGPPRLLEGTVEIDETYVGGKPRHAQYTKKSGRKGGRGSPKAAVLAMVERGGHVHASPIADVTGDTLLEAISQHVRSTARIMTDEWTGYRELKDTFKAGHQTVCHSRFEYVRGEVHTNTVEGFFGLLKRQIYGTHHAVSRKHLGRYVSEACWKYNTRTLEDGARVLAAIKQGDGKRLTYAQQVGHPRKPKAA